MSDMVRNPEENKRIDLLNRQDFVERFVEIADILAQREKSVCYAINGEWGVGKTFVIDLIEKAAKDGVEPIASFMLFHYNCWENDYYDEPLMAIVSSMVDAIKKKDDIFSDKVKRNLAEICKIVGNGLWIKALQFADEKTGGAASKINALMSKSNEKAKEQYEKDHEYNQYLPLQEALKKLQELIRDISKNYPVMFIVDELDRCLPEYAIKTLERLHHIFYGIPNVQVVLAIDKKQLEHTVCKIFGDQTDVNRYLAKFISFQLNLPEGSFTDIEKYRQVHEGYLSNFSYRNSATTEKDVDTFIQIVFEGLDIRSKTAIIDKCHLLHELLKNSEIENDYSLMCIEVFLAVVKFNGIDLERAKKTFKPKDIFKKIDGTDVSKGLLLIANKWEKSRNLNTYYIEDTSVSYVYTYDIWGVILASYRCAMGIMSDHISGGNYQTNEIMNYSFEFWTLLNAIS